MYGQKLPSGGSAESFDSSHPSAADIFLSASASSVCGTRQKFRLTEQTHFMPTTAHSAPSLDSATGGGKAQVHTEKPWGMQRPRCGV